jgi:RHS repeat-associated protein
MLKASYPDEYYYQDTYDFGSSLQLLWSSVVYAQSWTNMPGDAEYDSAAVSAALTPPVGNPINLNSGCWSGGGYTGVDRYQSMAFGTWSLQATHYLGWDGDCSFAAGTTSATLNISGPSINYFYSSPSHYALPGSTTLYWSTSNASSATINGTAVSVSGSMVVSPSTTTTYTLIAYNSGYSAQASTTVGIDMPLSMNGHRYSVRHEKGTPPFFPYTKADNETVNVANGNLFFTVPLVSRPGRAGLGIDLKLAYNSKIWDFYTYNATIYATLVEDSSWVGTGWTLLVGRVIDDSANGRYYITLSDGSNHELTYYGGAWRSMDSTYMIYDPVAHKLTLKGGTNLSFGYQDTIHTNIRYATRVQDANGNYLDITYADNGGRINTIQDTLGNTYTFLLNSQGRLAYISYFNTNDTTQATSTISLEYQGQSISFGSGAATASIPTQELLTQVTYITGLRYTFTYGGSGEVSQITYPTFATSRYFYQTLTVLERLLNQTVPDHYVSSHDRGDYTPTWTWYGNPNGAAAASTTTVTIQGSQQTYYSYLMGKSGSAWADGFVIDTKYADSPWPGFTPESQQDWTQDDTQLSTIENPRVSWIKQVNTDAQNPQSQTVVRKEFTYASSSDYSGNLKEIREYSYSGTLRRRTDLNYAHESSGSYVSLNILDRVTDTLIYDGSSNLISKTSTAYDSTTLVSSSANATRHDTSFGTSYLTRGLPTSVSRWYNIAQNLSVVASTRYDEFGNPRQVTDPRSYTTYTDYWLTSADNAYAFPLRMTNAKGHVSSATYSYKSGAVLTQTDPNSMVTTTTYDSLDRPTDISKTSGAHKTITYVQDPYYGHPPYATVRQYLTANTYTEERSDLDEMGRLSTQTLTDSSSGNIQQDLHYDARGAVSQISAPYRSGSQTIYQTNYHGQSPSYEYATYADGTTVSYTNYPGVTMVNSSSGGVRDYWYQEDHKVWAVTVQNPSTAELNVNTYYSYDAMGRLTAISQGIQTRSFTYDNLGRLLTETHPESGTTSYSYDANSNMVSKTNARGILTTISYDELNRVTQKSYSDGTPSVTYYYDTQPSGSPIATVNPVGRLTGVTRTVSGITVSSYYAYCSCSSITEEATVINDGTPRTYITNYAYNLAGQLTTLTYPNGKIVTYTLDDNGRQTKVSSTYNNQPFDYIYSATYGGPAGQLTQVQYPILYYGGQRVQTLYTYAPDSGYLTHMESFELNFDYNYVPFEGPLIQDITDWVNLNQSQHYEYDLWHRLTGYWQSRDRDDDSSKIPFGYDLYNNVASVGIDTFTVAASTNRLTSRTWYGGNESFAYDAAGNMTTMGTFDAENRLILTSQGASYVYDGNGRRFRTNDGNVVNYVYSYTGQLLTEDRITESASNNYIYFNGQVVAIHQQDDSVLFLFKDHLGSTRWVVTVSLSVYNWQSQGNWTTWSGEYVYEPFGHTGNSSPTRLMFQGKERSGDLDYYGARYYDSRTIGISSMRWISADSVTSRIYDPPSLNKYTYVRNDPVNLVDPDGREPFTIHGPTTWAPYWEPDLFNTSFDVGSVIADLSGMMLENLIHAPIRGGGIDSGDDGGEPAASQSLQALLANKALLQSDLSSRTGIAERKGDCYDFLVKVINQLNNKGLLAANFTVQSLIDNVMAATKIPTTVAALGANAQTNGNTINIASDPTESVGNDYISTLLHEGFHLLMSGNNARIDDDHLMPATSAADGTPYQGGGSSWFNKQMFGRNCGGGI